jgi:hypothetical protein
MTADLLLASLNAGRHALARSNPELLEWTTRSWDAWLRVQRTPTEARRPRLLVVATLSCVEDLSLHAGVMQLLASPALQCTLVLAFPTDAMARLVRARARRDEWEALVHIIVDGDLADTMGRVPAEAIVAMFRLPLALTTQQLAAAGVRCAGNAEASELAPIGDDCWFLGSAADFPAWSATQRPISEESSMAALQSVLGEDSNRLGAVPELSCRGAEPQPEAPSSRRISQPRADRLELNGAGEGDEIQIIKLEDSFGGTVIARQRTDLLGPEPTLQIRLPASFLTSAPHKIRVRTESMAEGLSSRDLELHVPASRLRPWMLSAFLNRGGGGNPVIRAFAQGVGCRLAYAEDEASVLQDIPVVWGVLRQSDRLLAQAKAQGFYFFYIDHAYFDRGHGKAYRITRNGYEAGAIRDCPVDRLRELNPDVLPWRKSGREIIICPPTEYFMQAHDCHDWLETTLGALRRTTDRPIKVRMKPQPGRAAVPLPTALRTAHALVTHSSNIAIEAACLGTPVFVHQSSAAAPVGATDLSQIENPVYPDREPWLAHLAYNQFSFEEIGDGTAWRLLMELEERDLV